MTDEPEASVPGSRARSRPQQRGGKRAQRPATEPPAPEPEPDTVVGRAGCAASLGDGAELAGTVVRASAELAEIGITLVARALRSALSRLPRP